MTSQEPSVCTIRVAILVWIGMVVAGFAILKQHQTTPGESGIPPNRRPDLDRTRVDPARFSMVIAAHPKCPCTKATINELARIMAGRESSVSTEIYFTVPMNEPGAPSASPTWQAARRIPGVRTYEDPGGRTSARYGLETSGHVLLFGPDGELRFSGGITNGRGHEGTNPGSLTLIDRLENRSGLVTLPVFGCALVRE